MNVYVFMCLYVYVCVCAYVCMYMCIMYVSIYVCVFVYVCVCTKVYVHMCMYVSTYICENVLSQPTEVHPLLSDARL